MNRALGSVVVMTALLGLYLVFSWQRAVLMLRSGSVIGVLLGLALCVLPLIAAWFVWREIQFGRRASGLLDRLQGAAGEGLLFPSAPDRSLTRAQQRARADEEFVLLARQAQEHPDDWRCWFLLGLAYDAAGDRRRGRAAIREAISRAAGS